MRSYLPLLFRFCCLCVAADDEKLKKREIRQRIGSEDGCVFADCLRHQSGGGLAGRVAWAGHKDVSLVTVRGMAADKWGPRHKSLIGVPPIIVVDDRIVCQVFTSVFTTECVLKMGALGTDFFRNGWNVFDFVIVLASLVDLGLEIVNGLSVLRGMRLVSCLLCFLCF